MEKKLKNLIYEIREEKVMFISDLANLYQIETKKLNQMIKRNHNLFSKEDYFQLTKGEYKSSLRSQIVTLNGEKNGQGNHLKYLPFVLTKTGIEKLSRLIKKEEIRIITKEIARNFEEKMKLQIVSESQYLREKNIRMMIYEVREKEVILDSDIAKLYGYSQGVKALNQAVKRNIERFPDDFYFKLTESEFEILRSQIVTANWNLEKSRTTPYVFTEQGVAMLSTILKTKNATEVSINIMRVFVKMHQKMKVFLKI